jgi:hypothetical protein
MPRHERTPGQLAADLLGMVTATAKAPGAEYQPILTDADCQTLTAAAEALLEYGKPLERATTLGAVLQLDLKQSASEFVVYATGVDKDGHDVQLGLGVDGDSLISEVKAMDEAAKMLELGALAVVFVVKGHTAYEVSMKKPCRACGGMGVTTHDVIVGGNDHDTEDRDCEACGGSGWVK